MSVMWLVARPTIKESKLWLIVIPFAVFFIMYLAAIWVLRAVMRKSLFESANLAFVFGLGWCLATYGSMGGATRGGVMRAVGILLVITFAVALFAF